MFLLCIWTNFSNKELLLLLLLLLFLSKSNIYTYWQGLTNNLLLDLNSSALEYGIIKSHKYCGAIL